MDIEGLKAQLIAKSIEKASSNLTCFALVLSDGSGFVLETAAGQDKIVLRQLPPGDLPALSDAVCTVDWGWIAGSRIECIQMEDNCVQLSLRPAGPLRISLGVWQGSPFLCFQPYRAAQSTRLLH